MKNVKKSKKFVIIGILAALLIVIACSLPWPGRVDAKMYGAIMTGNGEKVCDIQFNITGWKFNYLFRRDQLKARITFGPGDYKPYIAYTDNSGPIQWANTAGPLFFLTPDYEWTAYSSYQIDEDAPVVGDFAFTPDYDCCILTRVSSAGDYIVGSAEPDFDSDTILEVFEEIRS